MQETDFDTGEEEVFIVDGPAAAGPDGVLGRVISDDRSPTFECVRFRLAPGAQVRPGQFVAAECDSAGEMVLVLCRVLNVHEVNPHEDPLSSTIRSVLDFGSEYAPEGSSTVIYRLADTEPVEEVTILPGGVIGQPRQVQTLALAGGAVIEASANIIGTALGFLDEPTEGIHLGNVHGQPDVPVTLAPGAIQRHMLIVGGIGSGKSYTRGVIGEELRSLGAAQVNIDVNGEFVDAARQMGGETVQPSAGFTVPLSALTAEDLMEALTSVQRGTNIETLISYAFATLQRQVVSGERATFDVDDLVDEIEAQAPNLKMESAGTLRPAMIRARSLERLSYIGEQYDWPAKLQPGSFINIDCRGLLLTDLRIITAAVARDLQGLSRRDDIPFTVFSIDEFHLVAPNDDRNVSTQVLREIARIGRHYKIGLILTTQSPADVDRSILKRMLTRFLHAIEPDQLDSLRGVFADAPAELIRALPKLPQGVCLLSGVAETVRHAVLVDVRQRVTTHGGATPDVWTTIRSGTWGAKHPLEEIRP